MAVTADGKSAYATGFTSNTLSVFDRNPQTGSLTLQGSFYHDPASNVYLDGGAVALLWSASHFKVTAQRRESS